MKEPVAMNNIQANPVRLSHVPDWLRRRCLKAFGTTGGDTSGWHVLQHALRVLEREVRADYPGRHIPHWLDHWGSTKIDGQVWFVCEPYAEWPPTAELLALPHRLALAVNARLLVLPESNWNPPHTIRLTFKPNEVEP